MNRNENRNADGLTQRGELGLMRRIANDERKCRRWGTRPEGRQALVDRLEEVIQDDTMPVVAQIMAAKVYVMIEGQNQADERMAIGSDDGKENGPQVILVLPSNGTEIGAEDEG
jgi:hypothetical protein